MTEMRVPVPEITDAMRQHARANPNKKVYVVDPEFNADGRVPGWGIRGAFPVSPDGEISTDSYTPNPNYRPGPKVRGFPEPTNAVERALELAATGYGPEAALLSALASNSAVLVIPTEPGHPEHISVATDDAGDPALYAYTSIARLPASLSSYQEVPVRGLLAALRECHLILNAGSVPSVKLPGNDIATAIK
ncbi:type VII secretion system-associated protein [Saccharopolyspora shandongensis]|uniref:type VII secretion system-associated protein n=1 Tax=Saccharopolyspora shandongensis TaxID=418495 RepID=UPI003439EEE7